jgi:hypothetical protein
VSAALFDLALRVAARDHGGPLPRLLHSPVAGRATAVAVAARRVGAAVRVHVAGQNGRTESGVGAAGLAAIARVAGCAGGDLGDGATALVDTPATMRALASLASAWADPGRCGGVDVAAGSALAGWWAERAAHPGTSAVIDVLAATRQRFMLGAAPGADHAGAWRAVLSVPAGLRGLHAWHRTVCAGTVLAGLELTRGDDDWLLAVHQEALAARRTWDRPESLHLAAARLASRCDAADVYSAALLTDPLWRARGVHAGFVCHGEVTAGAGPNGNRVLLRAARLDTRLKPGSAVLAWPGEPMTNMPGIENRISGEVFATKVRDGALLVSIGRLRRRGYRPAAGETLTVIPEPPSPSTIRSRRAVLARLYKRRFSWLSQGATPLPTRRGVPLAVLVAAADEAEQLEG